LYDMICDNRHLTVEQVMAKFDISKATVFREYGKIKKITGALYDKASSTWTL
jgi:ATP-dependent DNA helicase RecG